MDPLDGFPLGMTLGIWGLGFFILAVLLLTDDSKLVRELFVYLFSKFVAGTR